MGALAWSLVSAGVLFSNSNYVHTALTVSATTPKSSSSLLTRLDNLVLKAAILFAQRLFSTLIASDLMKDCELLVDCGHPHSVMAMAKQEQETMRAELYYLLSPDRSGDSLSTAHNQ